MTAKLKVTLIKYTIQEIIGWVQYFFPQGHTKELLVLIHLGLEGVTEVDTDLKGRFLTFKVTFSNDSDYAPGDSTREQLTTGRFLEGLQNCMENKNMGNENKIIIGDFNFTMDKMERDGGNKTQILQMLFQFCPVKTHRG